MNILMIGLNCKLMNGLIYSLSAKSTTTWNTHSCLSWTL